MQVKQQRSFNGIAQADMAREFRYIRLERHEQEIVAKTYTYDVLGAALSRGWEVRFDDVAFDDLHKFIEEFSR